MKDATEKDAAMEHTWWGRRTVLPNQIRHWRIGPLSLWVQRRAGEWLLSQSRQEDPLDNSVEVGAAVSKADIPEDAATDRFGLRGTETKIRLEPKLADRAVVSRPDEPFHVPPGEETVLLVGTPLWVVVKTAKASHPLVEIPVFRPSDTWFGPTSSDGELCYASKTHCRLHLDDVPIWPHRCVTAVTIRNRAKDDLRLDRLKLPVRLLALYTSADGRLWTQDVVYERREGGGEHAEIRIGNRPPSMASNPRRLAGARDQQHGNVVMRAFSSLFA